MQDEPFSTSQDTTAVALSCQQGNLFFLGNPSGGTCAPLRGHVGGMSTPELPVGQIEVLNNTLSGTLQPVKLDVGGREHELLRGTQDFHQCTRPEQLQVRIGVASGPKPSSVAPQSAYQPDPAAMARARGEGPHVPVGQVSSARMPGQFGTIPRGHETNALDVIGDTNAHLYEEQRAAANSDFITAIEVDPGFGAPPGGDGTRRTDEMSEAEILWLAEVVRDFIAGNGERLGIALTTGEAILPGAHRAFLKEMWLTRARFYRMANGRRMVAFSGNNKLRQLITGTTYGLRGMQGRNVALVDIALRSPVENARAAATSLGSKTGVLGLVIVAAMDIAKWYALPEHERELSDLIVDLSINLTVAAVSTVIGTVIAGAAIAASAISLPVVLFVAAGIGFAIGVGWAIGKAIDATGLRSGLKEAVRNSDAPRDEVYNALVMGS